MGARLEIPFRRAGTADGRGFDADGDDSKRTALGDAGHPPPNGTLRASRWADRIFGQTSHGAGPLLVIAGAGTGKTRVITERIRHLLHSNPELSGENILGLTFTKKAAGEMKGRVVKTSGERGKAVTLATFR